MDSVCSSEHSSTPNRCSDALHRFLQQSRERAAHTRTERLAHLESKYRLHLQQHSHSHSHNNNNNNNSNTHSISRAGPIDAGVIEIEMLNSSDDDNDNNNDIDDIVVTVEHSVPGKKWLTVSPVSAAAEPHGVSPEFVTPPTPGPSPKVPEVRSAGVTRCLLSSFGLASSSQAMQMDEELKEFSEWEEKRRARRKQYVRGGGMGVVARAYAHGARGARLLRMISLDDKKDEGDFNTSPRTSLTPTSDAARFIEWIASEVDCYEDLLLHCTPMSIAAKRSVVDALCETVINRFSADFILDCMIQPCFKKQR